MGSAREDMEVQNELFYGHTPERKKSMNKPAGLDLKEIVKKAREQYHASIPLEQYAHYDEETSVIIDVLIKERPWIDYECVKLPRIEGGAITLHKKHYYKTSYSGKEANKCENCGQVKTNV